MLSSMSPLITDPQKTDLEYLKNLESEHLGSWSLSNLTNEIGLFCNPSFWLGGSILHCFYNSNIQDLPTDGLSSKNVNLFPWTEKHSIFKSSFNSPTLFFSFWLHKHTKWKLVYSDLFDFISFLLRIFI